MCCAGAGEQGRLSENRLAIMWGWSRRTGGQALKGGGRQQAALKTRAKRAQATGEIHVLFTEDGLGLRMAAELGCNAFKLERLAQRLSRYALLSFFVQVHRFITTKAEQIVDRRNVCPSRSARAATPISLKSRPPSAKAPRTKRDTQLQNCCDRTHRVATGLRHYSSGPPGHHSVLRRSRGYLQSFNPR